MFKHVLISTDGSAVSKGRKSRYRPRKGAWCQGHRLLRGRTGSPIYGEDYGIDQEMIEGIEDRARQEGQQHVAAIGKIAKSANVPFASLVTKANTAYEGIIEAR
jgi:hypothetical protein